MNMKTPPHGNLRCSMWDRLHNASGLRGAIREGERAGIPSVRREDGRWFSYTGRCSVCGHEHDVVQPAIADEAEPIIACECPRCHAMAVHPVEDGDE